MSGLPPVATELQTSPIGSFVHKQTLPEWRRQERTAVEQVGGCATISAMHVGLKLLSGFSGLPLARADEVIE